MFSIMAVAGSGYVVAGEEVGPAMAQGAQLACLVGNWFVLLALVVALLIPRRFCPTAPVPAH
ncbi:hypothetical protein FHG66_17075 [Rubellimicrobium rubrum]|uniref:Uncharacterized protein n=1 Tax=Rubellimicrobium rubrum TaxID=2585369 RepID=A0A5C4MT64_9RHOB|nr:hypothetical protein [Rubellimicrobium rubrum]TNC47305.1 hypothetical protein FHG66_17075 [Rubellimicrobium rubrum]